MSTNAHPGQNGYDAEVASGGLIDTRPRYVPIGDDTEGATHVHRTADETIHVFDADGHWLERFDLAGRTVDDYVAFVRDECEDRDWIFGREDVYGGINWTHRETGQVVELRRRRGPAARRMTKATVDSPDDVWYEIYVRPGAGEPAVDFGFLPGYTKEYAIKTAYDYRCEHIVGGV